MAKKTTIKNKEAFIDAVNELAKKLVRLAKLEAARDLEIQKIQEKHSYEIESLNEEIKEARDDTRLFAEDNRATVFPDAESKTGQTELAIYRFYLTPPKIALLNKKFDDDRCVGLMKSNRQLAPFIRPKEEIDRASLLAAIAENNLTPADLEAVGLKHSQSEKFEVKPRVESGEKVTS